MIQTPTASQEPGAATDAYLDLLKKCLTRLLPGDGFEVFDMPRRRWKRILYAPVSRILQARGLRLATRVSLEQRVDGRDWPTAAETMIGLRRLENIQFCVTDVLRNEIPGDLIETGVWRGGATIFMRGVLKAYGDLERRVWLADSFRGLPKPDVATYPADAGDKLWTSTSTLGVSIEQVRANFSKYGLLDEQVRFLPGWFRDTLPAAPIERLAVLRLDGDLYESTMIALDALYPKLSVGGYVIVDDYGAMESCRHAVEDFRARHGIGEPLERVDWTGVYWRRSA
jgi:O-methyltransferase